MRSYEKAYQKDQDDKTIAELTSENIAPLVKFFKKLKKQTRDIIHSKIPVHRDV